MKTIVQRYAQRQAALTRAQDWTDNIAKATVTDNRGHSWTLYLRVLNISPRSYVWCAEDGRDTQHTGWTIRRACDNLYSWCESHMHRLEFGEVDK
jgi:hypothetical protein